ncbi:MAG: amino acid ABC transporter substrate-binding protein [Oscillospiraceae bacterium]
MKKLITLILATTLAISLIGCGKTSPTDLTQKQSSTQHPDTSNDLPKKTELIIGLDDQFPPMGFRDDNNNIVGFDIDLANEVAKRLDMKAVPTPIEWSTKELELNSGKVDVLWNGMTITADRQKEMLMSTAYIKNAQAIVVKSNSEIQQISDLEGKKVAYQEGSSAVDAYEKSGIKGKEKEIITASENITLLQDLKIGRIDAVIIDRVVADYYIATNAKTDLIVLDVVLADEEYGFGFKKDNTELADKVFNAMEEMVEDGTAKRISEKWFGEDRIVFEYNKK